MKNKIKLVTVLLLMGIILVSHSTSCNRNQDSEESGNVLSTNVDQENIFPTITDSGVEPFLIGVYAPNIPPQGEWYDNIEVEESYDIVWGSFTTRVSSQELKEIQSSDAFVDILSHNYLMVVMKNETRLMEIKCDENKKINKIKILSPVLKMSNGICVGMDIEDINKTAEVRLFVESGFSIQDSRLIITVQGVSKHIGFNLDDKKSLMARFVEGEGMDNWEAINEMEYEIPVNEGFGDVISSIDIY